MNIKFYCLFFLFPFALNAASALPEPVTPLQADHCVKTVTVYLDRAQVTREANVTLPVGKSIISFNNIPDNIDLKSLRGELKNSSVELLGISWERVITSTILNEKLNELERAKETLDQTQKDLNNQSVILETQQKLCKQYRELLQKAVSEQSATPYNYLSPSSNGLPSKMKKEASQNWESAFKMLDNLGTALTEEKQNLADSQRILNEQNAEIERALSLYSAPTRGSRINATLTVQSSRPTSLPLSLSYVTQTASWYPKYDARINMADSTVSFSYNGIVTQNSGEDWSDIDVRLSTAQPQISATPPTYSALYLACGSAGGTARQQVEREHMVQSQNAFYAAASVTFDEIESDKFSSVTDDGPAVTFVINGKQNIVTGDQPCQLTVTSGIYNAAILYECMPSERNYVYLKAKFKNSTPYPLLAGSVSIYRNAGFIGTSAIPFTAVEAELPLFAGIVDGISVVRTRMADTARKKGFLTAKDETVSSFRTTLLNSTASPYKLRLRETIPVSEIDEVKVALLDNSESETIPDTTPEYVLDSKTGLVYWDITVKPGETQSVNLTYSITR